MRKSLFSVVVFLALVAVVLLQLPERDVPTLPAPDSTRVVAVPPPAPADSAATDLMQWIAGRSVEDSSAAYRAYAAAASRAYETLRRSKLDSIAAFGDSVLSVAREARTVLYPFGGADVVYVTEFFPTADTIVLVGLEPPGAPFDWRQLSISERSAFLDGLTQSVSASNRAGFFFTMEMFKDFADARLNGVLHPILMYLGWKGYEILGLVRFDPAAPQVAIALDSAARGLRVRARRVGTTDETVFEYVQADLSDPAFPRDSAMVAFLAQREAPTIYLKAASYLLHFPNFSTVRATLIGRARAVLQDDTGFPLASLEERFSDIRVFGSYVGPIQIFANRMQPALLQRYAAPGVRPLNFQMGYSRRTNLQYATTPRP